MHKAVFLDRDGVITKPILRDGKAFSARTLEELEFLEDALAVLPRFHAAGFIMVVVTNQPDIARGDMPEEMLLKMHHKIEQWAGGSDLIRKIYYCPHDDADGCGCRKPKPGMLLQAAREWGIDPKQSFLIGDRDRDMGAGKNAGCKTVLLDMPYNQGVEADYRAKNILQACEWILKQDAS